MRRIMQKALNPSSASTTSGIANFVYATCNAYTSTTLAMALTSNPIENTEGVEIITGAFTPTTTANRVRVYVTHNGFAAANSSYIVALFHSSSSLAVWVGQNSFFAGAQDNRSFTHETTVTSTTTQSFSVRVGQSSGSTLYINGNATVQLWNGTSRWTMAVDEVP